MFKAIDKKDNMEANECKDTDEDKNLAVARQVQQNIQDVIDEWWSNDNLTEEQQIKKNELFPNGKPSSDEFLITFVKYSREKPAFKKLQEEIEKKKRRHKIIEALMMIAVLLISALLLHCLFENDKSDNAKEYRTGRSTFMKDYWW